MSRFFNSIRIRLGLMFNLLVILVFASSFAGFVAIDSTITNQETLNLVNNQGAQVYRMATLARKLFNTGPLDEARAVEATIQQAITDFDHTQEDLRNGHEEDGVSAITHPLALEILNDMDQEWVSYKNFVASYLNEFDRDVQAGYLREIDSQATTVYTYTERLAAAMQVLAEQARENALRTYGVVFVITMVTALVGFVVISGVVRSIRKLTVAAQQYARGDYHARADTRGIREVAEVSHVLNDMADAIQKRERELNEINQTLETRVEERTREMRIAMIKAKEAARIKSEFLSTMSHELRTPLNAVIGFSDMLLMGISGPLNEKQRHKIYRLQENGKRLLELVNDSLDLTRIEAGRLELKNETFSPAELATRLSEQMQVLAEEKNIAFITQIDPTLPNELAGDTKRLEQVAVNLLSNAIKFTDQGSVTFTVGKSGEEWMIQVKDTGIGIPPHAFDLIFEEFRQIDGTSKRAYKGTGLGLAITKHLVQLMSGKITVDSILGAGSTFTVYLPIITPEMAALQQEVKV